MNNYKKISIYLFEMIEFLALYALQSLPKWISNLRFTSVQNSHAWKKKMIAMAEGPVTIMVIVNVMPNGTDTQIVTTVSRLMSQSMNLNQIDTNSYQ